MRIFILLVVLMTLSGCMVGNTSLNNKITGERPNFQPKVEKEIIVTLEYHSSSRRHKPKYQVQAVKSLKRKVSEVLESRNYFVTFVDEDLGADLKIVLTESDSVGSATPPQEYLTGFSFGLIPSYTVLRNVNTLRISKLKSKEVHTYSVDFWRFNHLFMAPFVWTLVFIDSPDDLITESLNNYINYNDLREL